MLVEPQAHRAQPVQVVLPAVLVQQVQVVLLVLRDSLELVAAQVHQEPQVPQDPQVQAVPQGPQERLV